MRFSPLPSLDLICRFFGGKHLPDDASPSLGGKRILIANSVPAFLNSAIVDALLERRLRLEGHEVAIAVCDKELAGCLNCKFSTIAKDERLISGKWRKLPKTCARCEKNVSNQFGDILNLLKFSEYRSQLSHKDIRQLCEQNIDDPFWHHRGSMFSSMPLPPQPDIMPRATRRMSRFTRTC